ncbi:hypothetical protein FOCG_11488 [Fusarium oxysporum f. sp. radicis-lycopersici 26381]|uniref:Uncharacterized protein n=1 Tax=Fusarium oxysporum Fo47 TaxID=660027 RepID=W9KX47_FUSOX|nr:hypothetical protein FOZG_02716 [Fusarium oxysporum Fo47]EXL47277.1 hypothetical protein FOCG_11488 [Fusarium oxysporum f. sp. radicis-lycopersici 26381]
MEFEGWGDLKTAVLSWKSGTVPATVKRSVPESKQIPSRIDE